MLRIIKDFINVTVFDKFTGIHNCYTVGNSGNYTKIIYLAQTEDKALQEKAKWAADYLKLDYEYRFTGYGDLDKALRDAARI